jgi:uncharacterized protein YndB with AHSA1/START domain
MKFIVDKKAQTVSMTVEFDAGRDLVWDAYTKAEILDQWWAPKPLTSRTVAMDFEVGGRRFYAMVMPDGQERWSVQRYTSITPTTNFKFFNAFSDENENLQLPGSDWDFSFSEQDSRTTVNISIYNESLERMERIMADDGFRLGTEGQIDNLREVLARLSQQKGASA